MTLIALVAILVISACFMSAGMAFAWAIQQRTGQSGWVDACWTLLTGLAGSVASLAMVPAVADDRRPLIVAALAMFWFLRLFLHIVARTRGSQDDPRYAKMQEEWSAEAPRKMFRLLQIQAIAGLPLILAMALAAGDNTRPISWQDACAIAIFSFAIAGEAIADAQLRRFARDPANRGQVCQAGLWRWSRHPNYFFEWLVWVSLPVFAINLNGSYPLGWFSLVAPAAMYWLLTRVSGIPPLEDHMVRKYGDPYRLYQRTTSAFFPLPPAT